MKNDYIIFRVVQIYDFCKGKGKAIC